MITNCAVQEGFEISPRFRRSVEERIARLETAVLILGVLYKSH